jgi:hypothetical protein
MEIKSEDAEAVKKERNIARRTKINKSDRKA